MHRLPSLKSIWRSICGHQIRSFHFRHRASSAITPRSENFSQWYLDVISGADLAETSPVKVWTMCKSCMHLLVFYFDAGLSHFEAQRVRFMGQHSVVSRRPTAHHGTFQHVRQCTQMVAHSSAHSCRYFPLLIPLSFFGKEAAHVQGFAKECAVVTHHRLRASPEEGPTIVSHDFILFSELAGIEVDPDALLQVGSRAFAAFILLLIRAPGTPRHPPHQRNHHLALVRQVDSIAPRSTAACEPMG